MTYKEFIQNIIDTRGQWNIPNGYYYEKHHIVLKSKGGTGDKKHGDFKQNSKHPNCIYLYPHEHFIAHYLLAIENPGDKQIYFALNNMITQNKSWKDLDFNIEENAKLYEEARIKCCKFLSEYRSANGKGENNSFYNKHHSSESKEKMRNAKLGKKMTDEAKLHMSMAGKGRKLSKIARQHISEAKKGCKNPMFGKTGYLCPSYNKVVSDNTKNKMSANHYKAKKVFCEELNMQFNSLRKAQEFSGISYLNIKKCCETSSIDLEGRHWRYINNDK